MKKPTAQSVPNPHDAFFRREFARAGVAAEFLRLYLPRAVVADLDLSTLRLEDTAYVDPRLREHYSDLLFRVKFKSGGEAFVFFLLEHKSKPDARVALQVLRYMALEWERQPLPLPMIMPVVVYHGTAPWRVGRRLSDLLAPTARRRAWRRYLPDFEYYLCDLSRYADAKLKGGAGLSGVLKLLKHIFRRDLAAQLPAVFEQTARELPEREAGERLHTMVNYLTESGRVTQAQIGAALHQAATQGVNMETILDVWEKEWRQKGRNEGVADVALHLLQLKVGKPEPAMEAQIRALPTEKLLRLSESLSKFRAAADVERWLRRQAPLPEAATVSHKRPRR